MALDSATNNSLHFKNVLVTGGAGMIGSNIVKKLVQRGSKVVILDNLSAYPFDYLHRFQPHMPDSVEFIKGSILDTALLKKVMKNVDAVIHAAAYADVAACVKNHDID